MAKQKPKPLPIRDLFDRIDTETPPPSIPKFNPGEMILRLTPDAQVSPTLANPLGLRQPVLKFLAELRSYGLWRIEPLIQLGQQVWKMDEIIPAGPVPPPAAPGPGILVPPLLWGQASKELYRMIRYGDNASIRLDATRLGNGWVKFGGAPPRLPGLAAAKQAEIRRRLILRFDPSRLDEHLAMQIIALAILRFPREVSPPMMVDIERTPMRMIITRPSTGPEADEPIGRGAAGSRTGASKKVAQVDPVTTALKGEDVYKFGWYRDHLGYNTKANCLNVKATVALLDSGVDSDHPALTGIITPGFSNQLIEDYAGHGTHVCNILAGRVAPSAGLNHPGMLPQGKLVVYKVMSDDLGFFGGQLYYPVDTTRYHTALVHVLDRVIGKELRVINLSLGGETPLGANEQTDIDNLKGKGAVIVAAAGNHRVPGDFTGVLYPAAYAATISVGAFRLEPTNPNNADSGVPFEWEKNNYGGPNTQQVINGRTSVDIYAPGRNIWSALPTYNSLSPATNSGYLTGTSMAAPIVAAVVAAYLINNPTMGFDGVLQDLMLNPGDLPPNNFRRLALQQFPVCSKPVILKKPKGAD